MEKGSHHTTRARARMSLARARANRDPDAPVPPLTLAIERDQRFGSMTAYWRTRLDGVCSRSSWFEYVTGAVPCPVDVARVVVADFPRLSLERAFPAGLVS